jgi:hypothetical protein
MSLTVDWFNTPLFVAFRHAPKKIMKRAFGVPAAVSDTTNKSVPKARVVGAG